MNLYSIIQDFLQHTPQRNVKLCNADKTALQTATTHMCSVYVCFMLYYTDVLTI